MKTNYKNEFENMPDELNFSAGNRGKYAGGVEPLKNLILIEPDSFATLSSTEAVNEALRLLKKTSTEATSLAKVLDHAKAS